MEAFYEGFYDKMNKLMTQTPMTDPAEMAL